MQGHTHALFGLTTFTAVEIAARAAGLGLVQPHRVNNMPIGLALCAGAAILGALAPDLDAEESTLHGDLGVVGELIQGGLQLLGVQHRGALYSGLMTLLVFVVAAGLGWRLGYPDVGLALGLGYFSHVVLADALTLAGVPLFWPLKRQFHLLPKGLRICTGSPVEGLVFLGLAVALLGLLWWRPDILPAELWQWLRRMKA